MSSTIDLHMHTTFSDGSITPEELIAMVVSQGVKAISITDHDNTRSWIPAQEAAKDVDLEVIPGIEINTYWKDQEVHVLGYFIDPDNESLQEVCARHNQARQDMIAHMVENLKKTGKLSITTEDITSLSVDGGSIGRPHVAKAIVNKGGASSISEAFRKFLVPTAATYYRRETVTPHEAVEAIYESGGIAVIAHPGDMPIIEELATDLINYGLRGLEAYHRSHSPGEIQFHCSLAERLGLIVTGGTDFHGVPENYPNSLSRLHVPDYVLDELKAEHKRIKSASVKAS